MTRDRPGWFGERVPRWVDPALGVASIALGAVLGVDPTRGVRALAVLVAAGLILVGVTRLVTGRRVARGWLDLALAVVAVVGGVVVASWRGTTVPFLALVVGVVLVAHGVLEVVDALRSRSDRLATAMTGTAAVVAGLLALAWPRVSVWMVGVVLGGWLVLTGLRRVLAAVRHRPRRRPGVDRGHAAAWRSGVALLVTVGFLGGTVLVHRGDPAIVPDAFYTPPVGVPAEPGELIRAEPLTRAVPAGARAWRILYTTTDHTGEPAVASGTVLAPARPSAVPGTDDGPTGTGGASPLIAVAHGTTGIVPGCAPSLADDPFADGAAEALRAMVGHGWVAVTSDYVGLGTAGPHAYLVGPAAAHDVLDAVRAARELPGLTLDRRTVVWGHSQGGHGALWTGLLAPGYAPDVQVLGVAAFAPAADLTALAEGVKATSIGKVVSAYIAGSWSEVYDIPLTDVVSPGYAGVVRGVGGRCFGGRDALAAFATATQLSGEIFRPDAMGGPVGAHLRDNTPSGRIDVPVLIAQGDQDPLVLPGPQRAFVERWCTEGQPLDYREYPGLDHLTLVADGSPLTEELVRWTEERLAGSPAVSTCR